MIGQSQFLKLRRAAMNGLKTTIVVNLDVLSVHGQHSPLSQDYDVVVKAFGDADLERILNLMARREAPVDPKYSPITWRKALRKDMIDSLPNIHDPVQQSHIARSLGEIENEITVLEYNEAAKQGNCQASVQSTGQKTLNDHFADAAINKAQVGYDPTLASDGVTIRGILR